MYLGTM